MIRKPSADWQQRSEGAAVRTVRTAAAVAKSGADLAQRSVHVGRGFVCCFFAAVAGFVAISLTGLPSMIGMGAMSAFMFWLGSRCFAKARAAPV